MRACIRSLLVPALACLVITGIGFLGYASYNNGYEHGSLGYEYSQDNCGYQVGYQETAIPSESVGSSSQTIELKNPTFEETRDFILKDATSRNKFILNQYECRHFATDVNNNAEAEGLRCAFVLLCFDRGQHSVVAFDTTDRGLVFIEPQTDARIHPEVSGRYQREEIIEILIAWWIELSF